MNLTAYISLLSPTFDAFVAVLVTDEQVIKHLTVLIRDITIVIALCEFLHQSLDLLPVELILMLLERGAEYLVKRVNIACDCNY